MTTFKLLHLSDLHLCIQPGRKNFTSLFSRVPSERIDVVRSVKKNSVRSLLRPASFVAPALSALAEFVQSRAHSYDAIVISGDLSTSGTARDLEVARRFVAEQPTYAWRKEGRPVLSAGDAPLVLLPGNHDNYDANGPDPNPVPFKLKFESLMKGFDGDSLGFDVRRKENKALCLVYADFSFRSRSQAKDKLVHLYGGGAIGEKILGSLVNLTWRIKRSPSLSDIDTRIFWLIHFAPYDCGYHLELVGYDQLIAAANENGITQILCGHTHKSRYIKEGIVNVFCAGSASSVDCKNIIHELYYDFDDDRVVKIDYYFDRVNQEFTESFI